MLQEQEQIGNAAGAALLDERALQRERLGVGDHAEPADLELPHLVQRDSRPWPGPAVPAAATPGSASKCSSCCLIVGHELIAGRAVDEPMVVAERQIRHRPNRDRIVDDDRALLDRADAENRHLRLVDDRHAELRAELAGVGDGERAAVHFFRLELLRARPLGDVGDRAAQPEQVLLVGVLDDRHDQAALERDGDPEVDVLLVDDVVAVERGVDDRECGAARRTTALAMNAM